MSRQLEAERQSALLAALFAASSDVALQTAPPLFGERGERLRRGLAAYRSNAASIAERALAAAYPLLTRLVGADDGAALARALWLASPPRRGDLAEWGCDLPDFIETQADLAAWPYLADCARLDAALRRCEAAADADCDRASLALLAEHAPAALRLTLMPCVQLLASAWPIATLHAAHAHDDADDAAALAEARRAVAAGRAEQVVVARDGWRARVGTVEPAVYAWMAALQRGASVAEALAAAGDGFDFSAWLLQALQQGWLCKAEVLAGS